MTRRLFLLIGVLLYTSVESKTLLQQIKSIASLSEAAQIIENDRVLPMMLETRSYMAFLPNNQALQSYDGPKDATLIRYHLANLPYKVQNMPEEMNTDLQGNPRVYVSKLPSGEPAINGWEDYKTFINDALIIDANHDAETEDGQKQMLHIVDRVITPTVPRNVSQANITPEFLTPDAQKLLMKPQFYGLQDKFSIVMFEKRVSALNLLDVFNIGGKNTFFIPVDSAITRNGQEQDVIDKQVIHGHVVPDEVLFTRTAGNAKKSYKSLALIDNMKVFISMSNVTSSDSDEMTYYVTSSTRASDYHHNKGTVLARIEKGNIPVKNGVVHLIDRPLMVVASSILSYLQEEKGQLSMFYDLIAKFNEDLKNELSSDSSRTLFAPSNEAFKMVNKERLNQVKLNRERISKLLRLHIVEERLTTEDIVANTAMEIFQVPTMNNGRKLYFDVNNMGGMNSGVSLEGAGVNATITTPNIATKGGVIHIIDRILGIPSQTVYEKLATDPMLSATFNLSEQEGWNKRLDNRYEKYTLFVPSNSAWEIIHREMPSAYKKLFMGEFAYHVRHILERHMIVGESFSLDQLLELTTNTTIPGRNLKQGRLDMTRGKVYFQAQVKHHAGDYYTEWKGVQAKVIRPDVECVNGVVHVINKVMMLRHDVKVTGSAVVPEVTGVATLFATFFTVAFAHALHH